MWGGWVHSPVCIESIVSEMARSAQSSASTHEVQGHVVPVGGVQLLQALIVWRRRPADLEARLVHLSCSAKEGQRTVVAVEMKGDLGLTVREGDGRSFKAFCTSA